MKPLVFISHAAEDYPTADLLHRVLESHHIPSWLSPVDIPLGAKWRDIIREAIKSSKFLVVLHSARASTSNWVFLEVMHADENGVGIIPVKLEAVPSDNPLGDILKEKQWLDATAADRTVEEHFERLAAQIHASIFGEGAPARADPATYAEAFRDVGRPARAIPLVWWIVCGVVPFLAIRLEYGDEGFFLAQLSPHFFLYPLLIGFLVPLCMVPVWAFIFRRWRVSRRKYATLLGLLIAFAAYVTYIEVTSANPALWDFRGLPHLQLQARGGVSRVVDGRAPAPEAAAEAPRVSVLDRAHYLLESCPPARTVRAAGLRGEADHCTALRRDLHQALLAWREGGESASSYTHLAYIAALFVEVLTLGISVLALSIMVAKRRFLRNMIASNLLAVAFCLYFVWLPFRIVALHEKANLFSDIKVLTEAAVIILLVLSYGFTAFLTLRYSRSYVILFVQSAIGAVLLWTAVYHPDYLAEVFGRSSDPSTYPMITMAVLLIILPFFLQDPEAPEPIPVRQRLSGSSE